MVSPLLVCAPMVIDKDSWRHSYLIVRGEILGPVKDRLLRKHSPRMFFIDPETKLGDRRQPDTVVVLTINHIDWVLGAVSFMTPSPPCEKSKFWGSGGEYGRKAETLKELMELHHQE